MEINELLIAERIAKEATRRHKKELKEAQDQFEKDWPDTWAERLYEWDQQHPFTGFVKEVYLEYASVAQQIRGLEALPSGPS